MPCRRQESREGFAYMCVAGLLLVLAIGCFCASSYRSELVYVGITLLLSSTVFVLLYLARGRSPRAKARAFCASPCSCCCCCRSGEEDSDCEGCMTRLLCLQRPDRRRAMADAEQRLRRTRGRGEDHHDWRALERCAEGLMAEYGYLERYHDLVVGLEQSYRALLVERRRLESWLEGREEPSRAEVKALKKTLLRIKADLREALIEAETRQQRHCTGAGLELTPPDISHISLPEPPPYAESDPLGPVPLALPLEAGLSLHAHSILTVPVHLHHPPAADVTALPSDAPPSYEDSVSSLV